MIKCNNNKSNNNNKAQKNNKTNKMVQSNNFQDNKMLVFMDKNSIKMIKICKDMPMNLMMKSLNNLKNKLEGLILMMRKVEKKEKEKERIIKKEINNKMTIKKIIMEMIMVKMMRLMIISKITLTILEKFKLKMQRKRLKRNRQQFNQEPSSIMLLTNSKTKLLEKNNGR